MTGAVLAGGQSSRMGREKGLVELGGRKMVEIITTRLKTAPAIERVLLITNHPERFQFLELGMVRDRHPGKGPLAGIHAALSETGSWVFIAACDMPFLPAGLPQFLAKFRAGVDLVLPRIRGYAATVAALYGPGCLPVIEDVLPGKAPRLTDILGRLRVREVSEEQLAILGNPEMGFFSVNTPADMARAKRVAEAAVLDDPADPRGPLVTLTGFSG
ncbi:MAG: molybdenum cofactor guanylyltransferase [Thermaerobacter sp.]|nr:molybdenum cofactor guanylyltransferase [Thermaerobacter sp.]